MSNLYSNFGPPFLRRSTTDPASFVDSSVLLLQISGGGRGRAGGGGGIIIFCADTDAAVADRKLATPLRRKGVNVKLEHGVDWNPEAAAVADAVTTAINHADAVIFILSIDYLVGSGNGLQDKTAR